MNSATKELLAISAGRLASAIAAFILLLIVRKATSDSEYVRFSEYYAYLTFLLSFSVTFLNAVLVRSAIMPDSRHGIAVATGYFAVFLVVAAISIEVSLLGHELPPGARGYSYLYLSLSLVAAVGNAGLQLQQRYRTLYTLDFARNALPVILVGMAMLRRVPLSSRDALFYVSCGGVVYITGFVRMIGRAWSRDALSALVIHAKERSLDDFSFGVGQVGFNSLSSMVVATDRSMAAAMFPIASIASKYVFSADLITRIANALLFPINIRLSGQLGILRNAGAHIAFHSAITRAFRATLLLGLSATAVIGVILSLGGPLARFTSSVSARAAIVYAFATTLYLSAVILQKRYDYALIMRFLPPVILGVCFVLVVLARHVFARALLSPLPAVYVGYFLILSLVQWYCRGRLRTSDTMGA